MLKLNSKNPISHINSFFIEIILVLLFFSLSCAILIQVFSKSFKQNTEAELINSTVMKGQYISEVFSSCGDAQKTLTSVFGKSSFTKTTGDKTQLTLNKNWNISDNNITYTVVINSSKKTTNSGTLTTAVIDIYHKDKLIFSKNASSYIPDKEASYE